jgi:hypothetical protein
MISNLYFLSNYNNYYNREIKRKPTLADYIDDLDETELYTINDYNFEMSDGVVSEVIINFPMGSVVVDFRDHYLLVEEQIPNSPSLSRWFVVETVKIREGQYRVTLRRDLVADFLDPLLSATVYVEKGTLTKNLFPINSLNPLAFNQEAFTANQIKTSETLLKDKLGCKWIVGYLNKEAIKSEETITDVPNAHITPDYNKSDIQTIIDTFATAKPYILDFYADFDSAVAYPPNTYLKMKVSRYSVTGNATSGEPRGYVSGVNYEKGLNDYGYANMFSYAETKTSAADANSWLVAQSLEGKVVKDGNNYYRVNIVKGSSKTLTYDVNPTNDAVWYDNLKNYVIKSNGKVTQDSSANFRIVVGLSETILLTLNQISVSQHSVVVKPTHNKTKNEAFDAFAIPYDARETALFLYAPYNGGSANFPIYNDGVLAIAQELVDKGSEAIDLQLLPYSPLPEGAYELSTIGYRFKVDDPAQEGISYSIIRDNNGNPTNAIFWLSSSQFSTTIEYKDPNDYSTIEKIKTINQLDTWRLESGDYSSSFEFNMARNGGVKYFEVDCAYKPYQPYIHVAPNFGGLYGKDYDDTRGLVCSNTNYSLPRLNDAWESYERNNLNYMNAFNRQVQNMDVQRKYQKTAEIWSMIAGTAGAGGSGGTAGAIAGNAIGKGGLGLGIAGAVAGAGISVGAGLYDLYASDQIYKENKQHAIDQFNMSLQNIQAMPNTIAAVGALNPNNKVFPILSYYTCSDIEREAFLQKMKWNGMTIGVLTDHIADYINPIKKTYFKGNLVYIDTETTDIGAHEMSELANELAKGIIFDKGVIN